MVKNYVIDTNILIHDPDCLYKFDDNNVCIPHPVIEELDKFKKEKSERGYNTRQAIRNIRELRKKGDVLKGVRTESGGIIRLFYCENPKYSELPAGFNRDGMDNLILLCIKDFAGKNPYVIFVTNDENMQIKADILGIPVQEYKTDRVKEDAELYEGCAKYLVDTDIIDRLYTEKEAEISPDMSACLTENKFLILVSPDNKSALAQYISGKLFLVPEFHSYPLDVEPRGANQRFLMTSLLTDHTEIPLTIGNGPAGTGKTLLAVAAGLWSVMEEKKYKKVLYTRANVLMDREMGYLPGDEDEKMSPLVRGLRDNLENIFSDSHDTPAETDDKINEIFQRKYIVTESLAYFRGRSVANTYVIVDEAQNCTPRQMLSIITRLGANSKLVLLGDANQVDNTRLDSRNNGLVYAIERMKGSPLCEIITFNENDCRRSPLAKEASERLKE